MADDTDNLQVESSEEPTSDASPAENFEGTEETGIDQTVETEESEAPEQSDRAKSRQHELAQRLKESETEKESLKEKLARYEPDPAPTRNSNVPFLKNDQDQYTDGVRELTTDEFDREIASRADEVVKLELGRLEQKFARRDKRLSDIEFLEQKYPELKPGDNQNKELTQKVIRLYSEASNSNPDLPLKDFVEDIMALRESGQNEGREKASAEMVRNESEAPITPDAVSSKTTASSEEDIIKKMRAGELTAKEARQYLGTGD